ncbi:MAG: DNA polymerase III subunit delta' [Betaproteobacteria bacterium]|nr:DNA polymerase III subunit delta' [Betaproteobacteria bacterium]
MRVAGDEGLACGACSGCRYAAAGAHPDLLRLELLVYDDDGLQLKAVETIAIDRVRGLIDFVQLSSHRQRAKVAVIAPAERMNAAAANALLKTLEEPPPATFLLLVTDQPGRLPATVRSRCRPFPAPQPGPAEALAWLATRGVADAPLALAQAGGAPLAALAHADPARLAERAVWLDALARPERLPVPAIAARIDAGGKDERKARLAQALEWLLLWTGDLGRIVDGGDARRNPDFAGPLAALAARVAPMALFRYHRAVLGQRALLAHPLQPRLVAEALLVDYVALFN